MRGRAHWGVVALVVSAGILTAFHVGKAPPALPAIRAEFGLGLVTGGWVVSIFSVLGGFFAVFAGATADRAGIGRALVAGLGLAAAGSLLGSLAPTVGVLMAGRVLEGLGYIVVAVAAPSLIAMTSDGRRRRLALGLWGAYMPVGTSLMMLTAPLILASQGWRGLWRLLAVLTLIGAVVVGFAIRRGALRRQPPRSPKPPRSLGRPLAALGLPGPWLLAAAFTCYTLQFGALMAWLPSFLIVERGLTTGTAAALTALMVGINAPGNLMAGWLLNRGAAHWLLIAVAGGAMGLLDIGIMSPQLPDAARYGMCLGFSLLGGMLPATALSGVPLLLPSPDHIGAANGMLVQGANLGLFLGPPLMAAMVAGSGDWSRSMPGMLAAAAGILLLALAVRRLERRGGGPGW